MARLVLTMMIALLAIAGVVAGVTVTIALYHSGRSIVIAALAGAGTAVGAWFWAALLGLAMEIADSLRRLVWAAEGDGD